MCGIVGYVGHRPAADYLLEGLRRLEYRGYDSAGIATLSDEGQFDVVKAVGRIDALAERSGLDAGAVSVALVELELGRRVATLPGGLFQRLR